MNTEWTSFMTVTLEISRTESCGGMTAQERSTLVEQFGISEELLLRCERAHHAYCTTIFVEQRREARLEAILRMRELGRKPLLLFPTASQHRCASNGVSSQVEQFPGHNQLQIHFQSLQTMPSAHTLRQFPYSNQPQLIVSSYANFVITSI